MHHLALVVSSIDEHLDSARKWNPELAIVFDASASGAHFVYVMD